MREFLPDNQFLALALMVSGMMFPLIILAFVLSALFGFLRSVIAQCLRARRYRIGIKLYERVFTGIIDGLGVDGVMAKYGHTGAALIKTFVPPADAVKMLCCGIHAQYDLAVWSCLGNKIDRLVYGLYDITFGAHVLSAIRQILVDNEAGHLPLLLDDYPEWHRSTAAGAKEAIIGQLHCTKIIRRFVDTGEYAPPPQFDPDDDRIAPELLTVAHLIKLYDSYRASADLLLTKGVKGAYLEIARSGDHDFRPCVEAIDNFNRVIDRVISQTHLIGTLLAVSLTMLEYTLQPPVEKGTPS